MSGTSWNGQLSKDDYAIQFSTDDKELYKMVEKACQKAINLAGEKRGEAIDDSRNPWQKI